MRGRRLVGFRSQPVCQLLDLERFQKPCARLSACPMYRLGEEDARLFPRMWLKDRKVLSAVTDGADDGGPSLKIDQRGLLIPGDGGCGMITHRALRIASGPLASGISLLPVG